MARLTQRIRALETYRAIQPYLADDHCRRQSLEALVGALGERLGGAPRVLDLGCGEGVSRDFFTTLDAAVAWHGVDIADSPEVRQRTRRDAAIQTFDGIDLPYPDAHFDLVYCRQVLEHVRSPDALVADALRVLRPGGLFAGSVSYLEPCHSYSIFNFTPYGLVRVFADAGFAVESIRPGVDASLLINRQLANRAGALRFLWNRNYLHGLLGLVGRLSGLGPRECNFLKVQFAGHLVFLARRPGTA